MARGRPSYDTTDPYAYPISRLAREAMYARLEDAITAGRLPADHTLYLQVLSSLFPEDFPEVQATVTAEEERRQRRLRAFAFVGRLQRGAP
jgi:hypothetical protein